uniref:Synaptobrevin, longin-like domain protein n=1 Tax=Tanacetum cinerariifolium TaxID=118510 RepID=A0A6L2L4M2_TANCI|nr:hypothetical protein [Tanacetum cinerariifolium]
MKVNAATHKLTTADGKKVVINEACIRHDLKLNDAEGTVCLSNAVIFEELARMGLVKNLEAGVPFYMFPRFIQVFVNHQLGDMSHHKGIFVNPCLTKKVFANLKRVGTGFSGAVTPLFGTMMVQALEEVGDLPTDVQDTPIPDKPSSSQPQRKHKPRRKQRIETEVSPTKTNTEEHVPTPSNDPLPSGEERMQLKELIDLCTNLSNKVLNLENEVIEMKSSQRAKIKELESRVEKLEEENNKEESSKQGRKIAYIDADAKVNLENVYNLDMAHEETVLSMQDVPDADVKEVDEEVVELMEIAKIIVDEVSTVGGKLNAANEKPVSATPTNITTAQPSEATKITVDITTALNAKGIVFHDKEESTTRTDSSKSQAKDKGKAKLVEEPEILKSRKAQIALDEEVARGLEAEWNADIKDNIN